MILFSLIKSLIYFPLVFSCHIQLFSWRDAGCSLAKLYLADLCYLVVAIHNLNVICYRLLRPVFSYFPNLGIQIYPRNLTWLLFLNASPYPLHCLHFPLMIAVKQSTLLNHKLVGFEFNMNIMPLTPSLMCSFISTRGESNKPIRVIYGLSNQQMGNKLQRGGSNLGPSIKPSSNTMLNDQLS